MILACPLAMAVLLGSGASGGAEESRLRYGGRTIPLLIGEVVGIEGIGDGYALACAKGDVALLDLQAILDGSLDPIRDSAHMLAFSSTTGPHGYSYVNLRLGGFQVLQVDLVGLSVTPLGRFEEPGVFYEKMSLTQDRLYVAAHAHGLRIFDLTDPAQPAFIGILEDGLDDALAVAVDGQFAYVADGAGGLKIVDVRDETTPLVIAGENPESAAGTAEDVRVIGGHVYVAAGGAGVAFYPNGRLAQRVLYDTPTSAKDLGQAGDFLLVADSGGLEVFRIEADGSLVHATSEMGMYLPGVTDPRLWSGVSNWGTNRVLTANWISADLFEIVDPALDSQPDITASLQRIRFPPTGGVATSKIRNDGSGPLTITEISSDQPEFSVDHAQAVLQPGETFDLVITYAPLRGGSGTAEIALHSDDPDESPLPIHVFGATIHLDPGEPAVPFVLPAWSYNHQTEEFEVHTFDSSALAGQVIYFHVYTPG